VSSPRTTLIVGAGIVGLTSAFRLARAGHVVTVFDPAPAHGATWAAAGMLAPSGEIAPGEESNYRLQTGAVAAWEVVAEELAAYADTKLQVHHTGTLLVGWDHGDHRLIDQFAHVAAGFGARVEPCTRAVSPEFFRSLSDRIHEGLFMPDDAWIDPDEAVRLLREALETLGVQIVTEHVVSVSGDDSGVSATTDTRTFSGDVGILATGSWALPRGALPSGDHVVRPVLGVTVRVRGVDRGDLATVRAFVRGRPFYMVSRPGGYCVLGATVEERDDTQLRVGELERLLRDALDVVPELETASVIEHRVGLRPASTDLQPFFELLATSGWAWSTGHYRHGVTLAPLSALRALDFVGAPS
jgi:glycine oxidase